MVRTQESRGNSSLRTKQHRMSLMAVCALLLGTSWAANQCHASFHFMQIEKVVGGVNGDASAQAIQLRTRSAAQGQVNRGKLIAWNAQGENPVIILDFESAVPNGDGGARILLATSTMSSYTNPPVVPDFTLQAAIPQSYLAAGSLTFENDEETLIVWRLSWGGDQYTGDTTGARTNDDDREFGPPFDGPLPTSELQALGLIGSFDAKSNSNLADYFLSEEPGVLTNNANDEFVLTLPDCSDPAGGGPDSDGDSIRDVCDGCPDDREKDDPGLCGCGLSDVDSDDDGIPDCNDQGGGNNGNTNGNDNDNGNVNSNDNVDPDNGNGNTNDNSNANANDNTGGPGDDNSNDNTGGESGAPRGCTGGIGLTLVGALSFYGLSLGHSRVRCRRIARSHH